MYKLRVEILKTVPAVDNKVFAFSLTAKKVECLQKSINETAVISFIPRLSEDELVFFIKKLPF